MASKRTVFVAVAVAALTLGLALPAAAHDGQSDGRTYEVTIFNRTKGQPFTPALVATHNRSEGFFRTWRPASFELKEIAENGNLAPMMARIDGDDDFYAQFLATGAGGPIMPGEKVTFEITTTRAFQFVSWASMLICTNDGFTGVNRLRLPSRVGRTVVLRTWAYDAGTEQNTQLFKDLVPPCGPLTGQGTHVGSGASNPDIAEHRVIRHHRGIVGVVNDHPHLDPRIVDWHSPVAKIKIKRTG